MYERQSRANLFPVLILISCILMVGVLAGVLLINRQQQAVQVIRVPEDYPTIQQAIDAAEPADIIEVQPGTYRENILLDRAVTLAAATFDPVNPANNSTIIDGTTGPVTITIAPGLTQLPTIRGFTIQGVGIGVQAASPFVVEFNYFISSSDQVHYQWGAGGFNRNNLYFQAGDDAIHLDNTDRPLLIENNRIMYASDDGIEANLQDKPSPPARVDVNIWNNMILGNREAGLQLVDFPGEPQDTNRRFVVVGNLFANNGKAGIGMVPNTAAGEDFSGAAVVEVVHVFNNTFYGNSHGISGGANLVAFNNIITNSTARGVWRIQGAPGTNSVVAYTLFYNNRIDAEESLVGPGVIAGQDPLFSAEPNPGPDGAWGTVDDDFSGLLLQATSPAIDRGVEQFTATNGELIPASPITGYIGAAPDLGWREFGSPIIITPTASAIASPTFASSPAFPSPAVTFTPVLLTPTVATQTPLATPTILTPTQELPTVTSATTPLPTLTLTGLAPPLNLLSITPNNAVANVIVNLTLTGTGFQNGAVVAFEGGQGIPPQVMETQVVNDSTIVITVNTAIEAGVTSQIWDVRVSNPGNSSVVQTDAFTVIVGP
jgi:hypothetical protein